MKNHRVILPGATLGVFGGGQLGRMFTHAAQRMGYHVVVFAPETDCPAGQAANEHVCAKFTDEAAIIDFANRCDAVTIEFENVPVRCLELAGQHTMVRPGPDVLAIAQHRLHERAFLDKHHLPTSPHATVDSADALRSAVHNTGAPGVLKAARFGYDGRGQIAIHAPSDLDDVWHQLGTNEAMYEAWVDYQMELSVLVARSNDRTIKTFGPIENEHANHILDTSTVPAALPERIAQAAIDLACDVADAVQLEGLICVEMFLTRTGELLINELAPRPHNSGHLTIEAATSSQFEQQVRALCGLPLADMNLKQPASMVNLLGDLWGSGNPCWSRLLSHADASLHLYGKSKPHTGRKMGHLTAVGATPEAARMLARQTRESAQYVPTTIHCHRQTQSLVEQP